MHDLEASAAGSVHGQEESILRESVNPYEMSDGSQLPDSEDEGDESQMFPEGLF